MKKMTVIASIGLIALLVLVSFNSIASAQAINSRQTSVVQQIKDKLTSNNWKTGDSLGFLAGPSPWAIFINLIFHLIIAFILGLH